MSLFIAFAILVVALIGVVLFHVEHKIAMKDCLHNLKADFRRSMMQTDQDVAQLSEAVSANGLALEALRPTINVQAALEARMEENIALAKEIELLKSRVGELSFNHVYEAANNHLAPGGGTGPRT